MRKKFKDVKKGEKIFVLRPFTFQIHEAEVKNSAIHPKTKKHVWVLEFYIPFKNQKITTQALKDAETHGFAKTATTAILDGNASMCTLMIRPAPTQIATTKEEIEQWLQTATPNDLASYLQMKKP